MENIDEISSKIKQIEAYTDRVQTDSDALAEDLIRFELLNAFIII